MEKKLCKGEEIKLQGIGFEANFLAFCLDGDDVVLGMESLESLGDIKANFKDLKLRIKKDVVKYNLVGDHALKKKEMSAKQLVAEDCGILLEDSNGKNSIANPVAAVLQPAGV